MLPWVMCRGGCGVVVLERRSRSESCWYEQAIALHRGYIQGVGSLSLIQSQFSRFLQGLMPCFHWPPVALMDFCPEGFSGRRCTPSCGWWRAGFLRFLWTHMELCILLGLHRPNGDAYHGDISWYHLIPFMSLRIIGPSKLVILRTLPLLYRFKPFHWRVQDPQGRSFSSLALGWGWFVTPKQPSPWSDSTSAPVVRRPRGSIAVTASVTKRGNAWSEETTMAGKATPGCPWKLVNGQ